MLSVEYDEDLFKDFFDVTAKILNSVSLFSRNFVHLLSVLVATHVAQSSFSELCLKLVRNTAKDMLAFEKSVKDKSEASKNEQDSEFDKSTINIKRTIAMNVVNTMDELKNEN